MERATEIMEKRISTADVENISMPLLQAAMGHTTSQTTARYYNKARHATETILKTQRSVFCDRDQISGQAVTVEG